MDFHHSARQLACLLSILVIGYCFPSAAAQVGRDSGGAPTQVPTRSLPVAIGSIVTDCPDCPEMVRIPGLGRKTVLFAGRFEVTWHQYLVAVREGACGMPWADDKQFDGANSRLDDDHPVFGVSLDQVDCYVSWLNKRSGKRYRLPSAEEWEHLARAGTTTDYYWGDGIGSDKVAIDGHFDREAVWRRVGHPSEFEPRFAVKWGVVVPVGSFPPNQWGLFDTMGNAIEMTMEVMSPFPACLRIYAPERCAIMAGRGNGVDLNYVDRVGVRVTATTGRHPLRRIGGSISGGFRLVRD